ncbi:MAG: type II secretion system protein GspM [Paracoccaceae bacterium]
MTALARFLAEKSPRERALMLALAGLVLAWLLATQVWAPLQSQRQSLAAELPRLQRALLQVQTAAPPTAAATDTRATPALITEAADRYGVMITRLQPEGQKVHVALEDTPFDTVILWIEALHRDHDLQLVDLTLTRRPAPGMVATTLTVER